MKTISSKFPIATPFGNFTAVYTENGLASLNFPNGKTESSNNQKISGKVRGWHRVTEAALKSYLAGQKSQKLPPLDLEGTEFQKSVWREMRKISHGKTKSYGEIAQAIGRPKAVRAVGGACGANPVPVFVPCHRVLAANKKIGGFSGGMDWKYRLLALEGVNV